MTEVKARRVETKVIPQVMIITDRDRLAAALDAIEVAVRALRELLTGDELFRY
jgi:hypothetical protein